MEYLENKKSFLDEIKDIFLIVFEGLSFGEKIRFDEKWQTGALKNHEKCFFM